MADRQPEGAEHQLVIDPEAQKAVEAELAKGDGPGDPGGEILPDEFKPKPVERLDFDKMKPPTAVAAPQTDAPAQAVVSAQRPASPESAVPTGIEPPRPPSPDELAFRASLDSHVNLELNTFHVVYGAVGNLIQHIGKHSPVDSADLMNSAFGPGQRTPLEQAHPIIALEVYKAVRENVREEQRAAGRGRLSRLLRWLFS